MPSFRSGEVEVAIDQPGGLQRLTVRIDGELRTAVLDPAYAARARPGDRVVVNTTAVDLGLGTGGDDFVVWNLAVDTHDAPSGGHIMKLRYTHAQRDVLSVEAPESPHHATMLQATSLDGAPVVAASLHSQLLPITLAAAGRKAAYVMTDGAALPAAWSNTLQRLDLAGTVTCGHAFGGTLEAVTLHSGLLAAKHVLRADIIVAGLGPGVVGTDTPFGTTGLEVGTTINAVAALGGRPVVALRMSSGDPRERHQGVSHHAITALTRIALARALVAVPKGVWADVGPIHEVAEFDTEGCIEALEAFGGASHMGRSPSDDPLFFSAAWAAGLAAASLVG